MFIKVHLMNLENKFMVYYISRDMPNEKTSIQKLKWQRVFFVFLLSVDIGADVMYDGVFRCT